MDVISIFRMGRGHMYDNALSIIEIANFWMSNKGRVKRVKNRKRR